MRRCSPRSAAWQLRCLPDVSDHHTGDRSRWPLPHRGRRLLGRRSAAASGRTKAGDAPDVASAANISAFTLGSANGIYQGGAAIDGGLGVTSVNWVGGMMIFDGVGFRADLVALARPIRESSGARSACGTALKRLCFPSDVGRTSVRRLALAGRFRAPGGRATGRSSAATPARVDRRRVLWDGMVAAKDQGSAGADPWSIPTRKTQTITDP